MGSKELVLLADSCDDRVVTRISLEHEGYGVELFNTLDAARKAVSRLRPAVVVIDCRGRCREALALMRELKGNPDTASTLVIALTACPGLDGDCKALEHGADRVMHKDLALDLPQELQLLLRGPYGQ